MTVTDYRAIRKFLREHSNIGESRLGRSALNCPRVISDVLRRGRRLRRGTMKRLLEYMSEYDKNSLQ